MSALGTWDAIAVRCCRGTEVQYSPGALRCTLGRDGFLKEFSLQFVQSKSGSIKDEELGSLSGKEFHQGHPANWQQSWLSKYKAASSQSLSTHSPPVPRRPLLS